MILMTENELYTAFDKMTPSDMLKERMLNTILNKERPAAQVSYPQKKRRKHRSYTVAACLALIFSMVLILSPATEELFCVIHWKP
jgi:hypothetical protein